MSYDDRTINVRPALKRGAVAFLLLAASLAASLPFSGVSLAAHSASRAQAKATLTIGEKSFDEEYIIGDMYALLLQKAGFGYKIIDTLGSNSPPFQTALKRGDIDIYPEYTGTGLTVILNKPAIANANKAYKTVKRLYQKKFKFAWLHQTPMNDTNAVAVTAATAAKYHLHNLTQLAKVAGNLTFDGLPECQGRLDCLGGMQKYYGIKFKSFTAVTSTVLTTEALASGQVDVAELFSTSPLIKKDNLVVLKDNKSKVFPADHIAPVLPDKILNKYPKIATVLNKVAPYLTTTAIIRLNGFYDLQHQKAINIARSFLKSKHLL